MSDERDPAAAVEMKDGFGVIEMRRAGRHNCLSQELVDAILQGFADLEGRGARAVVLRAQPGAKVWSAGHDIKEIPLDGSDPLTWNVGFEKLLRKVRLCPVPVLGLIEGGVWGGACDLAMAMDLLVGSPTATFAITPVKLGLPYNTAGLSHFLGVLPLHVLKEMLFTGLTLDAESAYRLGVLNRLEPPEEVERSAFGLASQIAARAPLAVGVLKEELAMLTRWASLSVDDFERIQTLRQEAYRSRDFQEGVRAFFERRDPSFNGD